MSMRKTLLATVAATAVVGFTTLAAAQAPEGDKGAARPQGVQQPKAAPSGAMMHQQGAQPADKTPQSGQSAQDQGGKAQEHLGQSQEKEKGVEPQNKAAQQRGSQEQPAKSGMNTTDKNAADKNADQAPTSRGGSAQLSQDQRTKMQTMIGHNNAARFTGNVNFNVTVGAAVPRNVHIEVLPEDVVQIVPEYQGFDYIVVGEELLIVDPRTLEIVAIFPV